MKHEFGHVLGIEHGEEPMPLMNESGAATYLSKPNATNRSLAWENSTLSVYVDLGNVSSQDKTAIQNQIGHALSYYGPELMGVFLRMCRSCK